MLGKLPIEGCVLRDEVDEFERRLIAQALERTGGQRKAAARLLGMNRTTLLARLKSLRLTIPRAA